MNKVIRKIINYRKHTNYIASIIATVSAVSLLLEFHTAEAVQQKICKYSVYLRRALARDILTGGVLIHLTPIVHLNHQITLHSVIWFQDFWSMRSLMDLMCTWILNIWNERRKRKWMLMDLIYSSSLKRVNFKALLFELSVSLCIGKIANSHCRVLCMQVPGKPLSTSREWGFLS